MGSDVEHEKAWQVWVRAELECLEKECAADGVCKGVAPVVKELTKRSRCIRAAGLLAIHSIQGLVYEGADGSDHIEHGMEWLSQGRVLHHHE